MGKLNIELGDLVSTPSGYSFEKVEICIFKGSEGVLLLDITPNYAGVQGFAERYLKREKDLGWYRRIVAKDASQYLTDLKQKGEVKCLD